MTALAGSRFATAAVAAAIVAVAVTQMSDAAAVAAALALTAVVAARQAGRGLVVAPAAAAAALVGALALPHGIAIPAAAAALVVAGTLVLQRRPQPDATPEGPLVGPDHEQVAGLRPSGRFPRGRQAPEGWRIDDLACLVEAHAAGHPERVEEWRAYVEFLRAHAVEGVLPTGFDTLVAEEFAPLLSERE